MKKYGNGDLFQFFKDKWGDKYKLSSVEYSRILEAYNRAFVKECVEEGTKMSIGGLLGHVQILRRSMKRAGEYKLIPDFPTSMKLKKEIIERGGTPLVNYRDEYGNIIGNNGGEKWLCYYTEEGKLTMRWIKHFFAPKTHSYIHFKPVKYVMRETLPQFKNKFPDKAALIYENEKSIN